jgi:HAMP domain-containing protein
MLGVAFAYAVAGGMLAAAFEASKAPVLFLVIGCALTLFFAVPITIGGVFSPSLQPIRDLAEGAKRVASGDYSRRLPVVQDDDLGALAASFNDMQAGLAERQRLQTAFGTYVDPGLAARLLKQGDDVFTGERREVAVMFVDIRDFTPFAEANTAEDTVARLNALFEIVVPAVVYAGGHVNKFLGVRQRWQSNRRQPPGRVVTVVVGGEVVGYVVVGLVTVTVLVLVLVLVDAGGTAVVVITVVTVVVGVVDEVVAAAAAITPQANRLPKSAAVPLLR